MIKRHYAFVEININIEMLIVMQRNIMYVKYKKRDRHQQSLHKIIEAF